MPLTLADLEKGYEFPTATFELSPEWVTAYAAATQDESSRDTVPPMAVAALSVRALLENAALPPGSIHAAQELAFHGAAHLGDTVSASARVVSRGERAGWVLMGFALESSANGRQLMTGRATLTFPLDGSA
jgi:acyl dehydratase